MMTDEAKYLVCPTADWVGHKPEMNVNLCARDIMKGVMSGHIVFEALGFGAVRPYADFEKSYTTIEEMNEARDVELKKCMGELRTIHGPNVNIFVLDSCGNKKGSGPMLSWHFILGGAGAYACPNDVLAAGLIPMRKDEPKVWDHAVYPKLGSQRLMRTFGASKYGEDRPFKLLIDGKPTSLNDLYSQNEEVALLYFNMCLIQNIRGEVMKTTPDVPQPQTVECKQFVPGAHTVAVGLNGEPLGSDIKITNESQIRELCKIAGWFNEVNRDYETWRNEMWTLQDASDDTGINLHQLMIDVSAVCADKHTDSSVEAIRRVTAGRPQGMARKNLGQLRTLARVKNEGEYLRWVSAVQADAPVVEEKKGDVVRIPYLFMDHNNFVGKQITQKTADEWLADALIMVMHGGDSYFLTRNRKICEVTNRSYEIWKTIRSEKMLNCLSVSVFIKNPGYDVNRLDEMAQLGIREFNYVTFGAERKKQPGYVEDQIYKRNVKWVDHEDFIPFLARRIPDADIRKAVTDKTIFNTFRGFPIEEEIYAPDKVKFIGSAWHKHLMNGICHGDMNEWKHLEASIADMIQRPYRLSNVAHVFQGKQGTGKSFLHRFMTGLLGASHTMLITDMSIYGQKFNEDHASAILKVFEEVRGKGDQFINNDKLKGDITKPQIRIEIKGGAILNLRNCARFWMLTNHRDTLHIEADDRRYVYHSVSAEHANDKEYFAPIVAEIGNREYLRACFEYFAELPYDEMFVMTAIATSYKDEQKIDSMPLPLKFLRDIFENGILASADVSRMEGERVSSALFYEIYTTWCVTNNHQRCSASAFLKGLTNINLVPKSMRINGSPTKGFVVNALDIRDRFREHFKIPTFEWEV